MANKPHKRSNIKAKAQGSVIGSSALVIFCSFATLLFALVLWAKGIFNVSFDAIIATLFGPLEGTGSGMVERALAACLPPAITVALLSTVLVVFLRKCAKKLSKDDQSAARVPRLQVIALTRRGMAAIFAGVLVSALLIANQSFGIVGWAQSRIGTSSIYETQYVDPGSVAVTADNPKNLIYIIVESLETPYASKEAGGIQDVNYIPKLTNLAAENISFSNTDKLGGLHCLRGTTWTMGALLALTGGVPFAFDSSGAPLSISGDTYLSGVVSLGDILEDAGYTQEFMCGSDVEFGGREAYFKSHGNYDFYDYNTAIEHGDIDSDYKVNWGFEDAKLFDFAKNEAIRLAQNDKPFNLTLLTVDLHTPDGFLCELCPDDYDSITANVAACNDAQIVNFVEWIRQQPFADDTVIIITGDHPRMDTNLVGDMQGYDRTVYNCFINAETPEDFEMHNREFTHPDIYPTILSALGFSIEGERLALGTNLFSQEPTLAEKMGFFNLKEELSKPNDWYIENLAPEMLS